VALMVFMAVDFFKRPFTYRCCISARLKTVI
jgi:hypothetical protein